MHRKIKALRRRKRRDEDKSTGSNNHFERCKSELNTRLRAVEQAERQARDEVTDAIIRAKQLLPLELIYKYGKGGFSSLENQRLVQMTEKTLLRVYHGNLIRGFAQWQNFTELSKENERYKAVLAIQCAYRMLLASRRVKRKILEREEREKRKMTALRLMRSKENDASSCIYRAIKAYNEYRTHQRCTNASIVIQRFFRCIKTRWTGAMSLAIEFRRYSSALKIQSHYRQHLAYRRVILIRKIRAVDISKKKKQYLRDRRALKYREQGAALSIQQHWKRKIQRRQRRYARIRYLNRKKIGAAMKIQSCYRSHLARKFITRKIVQEAKSVIVLQCSTRCWLSRRRRMELIGKTQLRKRSVVPPISWDVKKMKRGKKKPAVLEEEKRIAATKIQARWRGRRSRRKQLRRMVRVKELKRRETRRLQHRMATRIQKIVRGIRGRRRYWRVIQEACCLVLQRTWRGYKIRIQTEELRQRLHAVSVIKRHWKASESRYYHRTRRNAIVKIQSLFRRLLQSGRYLSTINAMHYQDEHIALGAAHFSITLSVVSRKMLTLNYISDIDASRDVRCYLEEGVQRAGVWQDMFLAACRWNSKKESLSIDNVRFMRFFKDIPKFLNDELSVQKVDVLFSSCANTRTRLANYSQFMDALNKMFQIRWPPKIITPTTSTEALPVIDVPVIDADLNETNTFIKFVLEFAFESTWGKKFSIALREVAFDHIDWAVKKIQKFVCAIMKKQSIIRETLASLRKSHLDHLNHMASKIQGMWKIRIARKNLGKMLATVVVEYYDGESGIPFYVNSLTGTTLWNKPTLLCGSACEISIKLPLPGEEFVVYCAHHVRDSTDGKTNVLATLYCQECLEALCPACFARSHTRESTLKHKSSNIDCCGYCKLQTATRVCNQCQDGNVKYCDTCYPHLHQKESLNSHKYTAFVVMCCECEVKAAQWTCFECADEYCKTCCGNIHRKGRRQSHLISSITYYSVVEKEANERKEEQRIEDELKEQARMARQCRIEIQQERDLEEAVIRIQSRFRAKCERAKAKEYMRLVRLTQKAIEQRQKDDVTRNKLAYKLKDAFGAAKDLKSDTLQEKQMREYKKNLKNRVAVLAGVETETLRYLRKESKVNTTAAATVSDIAAFSVSDIPQWCNTGRRVMITKGDYKNCAASVLSTTSVGQTGNITVYVEEASISIVIPLLHLRPRLSDEEEMVKASKLLTVKHGISSGFSSAGSKLNDAKHLMSLRVANAVEQKMIKTQIAFMENVEFKDIAEYAWKEVEDLDQELDDEDDEIKTHWWNVVTNVKVPIMPRGAKNFQAITDERVREEILRQMDSAEKKLTDILQLDLKYNSGARDRRNAINGSFATKKEVGAANKFFMIMQDDEYPKNSIVKGLNGIEQEALAGFLGLVEDTPGYGYLLTYFSKASKNEKLETIEEIQRMNSNIDSIQHHLLFLSSMTLEEQLHRRQDIEKRRGVIY